MRSRSLASVIATLVTVGSALQHSHAAEPIAAAPQRILLVGKAGQRADDFTSFLQKHFQKVEFAARPKFDPKTARDFDVVLLDWSQDELDHSVGDPFEKLESALGPRDQWSTPTVLLGSAGLLQSGQWDIIGGAG